MTHLCTSRSKAIVVSLLLGLTLACGKASPPPSPERPSGTGGRAGGSSGRTGGTPGSATGGDTGAGTGGMTANGGASGTGGSGTGGATAPDAEAPDMEPGPEDVAPEAAPEDATPDPDVPGCTTTCAIGRKRCSNDRVEECKMIGNCPGWEPGPACMAPMQCNQNGNNATCGCPTTCTTGRKRCANGMLEECVATNGCPAWGNPTACAAPMTCSMGGPNGASCGCPTGGTNCTAGTRRCMGNGVEECKAAGPNTCPTWQAARTCAANQECTDPAGGAPADCRCKAVCTLGQKKCNASGHIEECATVDGCPAWKVTNCPTGQACTSAGGTVSCGCPAGSCTVGEKRCDASGANLQECRGTGPAGCGQFVNVACNNGQRCAVKPEAGGRKNAACECPGDSCTPGQFRCNGDGVHQRCEGAANQCGRWVADTCIAPQVCQRNTTGSSSMCRCPTGGSACTAIGSKRCSSDKSSLETCTARGQGCGEFVSMSCGAGNTCVVEGSEPAKCEESCPSPAACSVGETKCEGGVGGRAMECRMVSGCLRFVVADQCGAAETCQPRRGSEGPTRPPVPKAVCCPTSCEPTCINTASSSKVRECVADSNGCIVLGPEKSCTGGQTCKGPAPLSCKP